MTVTIPDRAHQLAAIRAAAKHADLDEACAHIQATIGQTDGGIAGMHFSGPEGDEYPDADYPRRVELLTDYMQAEVDFAQTADQ